MEFAQVISEAVELTCRETIVKDGMNISRFDMAYLRHGPLPGRLTISVSKPIGVNWQKTFLRYFISADDLFLLLKHPAPSFYFCCSVWKMLGRTLPPERIATMHGACQADHAECHNRVCRQRGAAKYRMQVSIINFVVYTCTGNTFFQLPYTSLVTINSKSYCHGI